MPQHILRRKRTEVVIPEEVAASHKQQAADFIAKEFERAVTDCLAGDDCS